MSKFSSSHLWKSKKTTATPSSPTTPASTMSSLTISLTSNCPTEEQPARHNRKIAKA